MLSTPSCASVSSIIRASSSGPISLTVVRTGWPLCAEQIPEDHRVAAVGEVGHADLRRALDQRLVRLRRRVAGPRQPGDVALHVLDDDRDAGRGQPLGENLQRHGLAGAGRAGDQPVAVGVAQQQVPRLGVVLAAAAHQDLRRRPSLLPPEIV